MFFLLTGSPPLLIHFSTNWAIINGEQKTGVTTFFIDDKIDTGAIILQEEIAIEPDDDAGSLHDRLMYLGAKVVLQTVKEVEKGTIISKGQEWNMEYKMAPKIHKETCEINWKHPLDTIYDFIRGLSPYPTAWTTLLNGEESLSLKIFKVIKEEEQHDHAVGMVVFGKKEMKVAVNGGYINLLEIQLPGKRKMHIGDVLNGLKLINPVAVV